jgi:UPF0755 protein
LSRGNRSRPANERTERQREADRLERERRRAEREGLASPPAPTESPVVDPAAVQEQPAPHHVEPEPAEVDTSIAAEHDPPPEHFEQAAAEYEQPYVPEQPYEAEQPLPWQVQEPAVTPLPAPAQRLAGRPPIDHDGGLVGGAGLSPGPRYPGALAGPRRPRITRARVAALLALLAAAALVWFLISLFQPFAGSGSGSVIVSIPKGSSASKIGSILARDGVVSSGFFFDVRALLEGKRSSLHSGRFQLKRGMSYTAAIDALSKPPPRAIAVKVVIPEGYTRSQIADLVREDALSGDYLAQTKRSSVLDPAHYGAPANTPDLEGFLFPATYELTAGAPVKRLVDEQLTAFRNRFTSAERRRARALGVTSYQLLTVASMIEREAQTDHDRPLIAAVIYNRLRAGIPLGIDATIYYAVELQKGIATYTGELTQSQLKIDSPYNTRTHKGLPPTPISNPGEASIRAAAHPAHAHYLYYVAAADGCGEQAFSDTYAQFEKNVAAYQAAVKKNGGHPPKCTKK